MEHSPLRTAVLVIDMQQDFCSPTGAMAALGADVRVNAELARRLPDFLDRARTAGCVVVWVRQAAHEQLVSPARQARAEAMGRSPLDVCAAGSWGAQLADGLVPAPGDCHLEKTRYSAFVGTPLHNLLRARGRDHVVVVGTAANVCVDSTIRDAYMADLAVTMPTDLVGWTRADLADAAIRNLGFYFCEATTSTRLVADWSREAREP
ncbi:cysteine hydrolase family protein [Micromonospora echinospora]|uniref:cysteine hydrolase family protein n=1 Tax=Micromonospora echinospora TaxID=1877 RepID=UPI003A8597F2